MDKNDIVKSNALIEACYKPTSVWQMRLLLAALMQIKAKEEITYEHKFEITANALSDLTNANAKAVANYRELKKAAKALQKMTIDINERPNGEEGAVEHEDGINVTSKCRYYPKQGKVVLQFGPYIIPYISSLKNRFTQYQAKYVLPMKSGYGIRLYELCLQWMGDEREFSVEDFKKMFGLEKKYRMVAELKRNVIDPAIEDINTYSDLHVTFGQRKAGRQITHFQFKIKPKKKANPPQNQERKKTIYTRADLDKNGSLALAGESYEEALRRLNSNRN